MAGYHLFSTGEVLSAANVNDYLMKQTTMIFASASARTTALSGVLREGMVSYRLDSHVFEVYNGTAWVASETNLTTKGDLAVYSTAPDRLAVGADGTTLVANSANSSGLGWSATPSASNPVLNSAMQIAQRGTSFSLAASTSATYTLDRWQTQTGANQATTVARQATGDTTNLPNIQYALRFQRNSGQTGTSTYNLAQSFESINSVPFAGKTITYSFYARAGANYSATSSALTAVVVSGTGSDQNVVTGFTGAAYPISQAATLTTTWQRFSSTCTVAATATQLGLLFQYTPTGTASTNDYYEVTGVQIDVGSVALPFRTYGATYQAELAACQRYLPVALTTVYDPVGGFSSSTTTGYFNIQFKVPARVAPTGISLSSASNFAVLNKTLTSGTPTAISFDSAGVNSAMITATTTAASPTILAGEGGILRSISVNGLILFTGCEL